MTTEILQKTRAAFIAQANTVALTAGYDPNSASYTNGGAVVTIDNRYSAGTENAKGAPLLDLMLDVTAAPATAASAQIWFRKSYDGGTTWTKWKYSHTVGDSIDITTAKKYSAGMFAISAPLTQLEVMAATYAFTANLVALPILNEAQ